jgi:ABC-type transport system substrate-binding protein
LNGRAHPYRTDKGIGVGATEDQVKSAYAGESVIRTSTGDIVLYNYPLLGLAFLIDNGPSAPREIRGRALGIFVRRPSGSKRVGPPRLALIGFSSKVSPGENEALRRALAHAIDKQAVATAVELSLQPLGVTPVPAYSVEHPRLSLVSQTPADIVPRYDPAKARAMFQESRWTGPVTVVAAAGEGDFFQRLLGAIQSSVREAAGAEIVYKFVEFQEYVRTIRSGEAPVFIVLWRATPDDFGFPSQALGIADAYIGADAEVRALLQRRDAAATEKALLEKALIIPLIHY